MVKGGIILKKYYREVKHFKYLSSQTLFIFLFCESSQKKIIF